MFLEIYYFWEVAPHDILQLKLILPCHKKVKSSQSWGSAEGLFYDII